MSCDVMSSDVMAYVVMPIEVGMFCDAKGVMRCDAQCCWGICLDI